VLIVGALGCVSRASLLDVALSGAGPAHCSGGCKLALAGATVFVGWVTHRVICKLASFCVAARIVLATLLTTAVAFFAFLDDTVTALAAGDGWDVLVVGQTV
jgi:hypothetical protein